MTQYAGADLKIRLSEGGQWTRIFQARCASASLAGVHMMSLLTNQSGMASHRCYNGRVKPVGTVTVSIMTPVISNAD